MEEPLTTYRDARLEYRRRFELYPDRVRVAGWGIWAGRFEGELPLTILLPNPTRQWTRGYFLRYGLTALFITACWSAAATAANGPEVFLRPWVVGVLGLLGWAGVMLTLASIRRVEHAYFLGEAGVIALDVSRSGREAADFDEFVDTLIEHIRAARSEVERPKGPQTLT